MQARAQATGGLPKAIRPPRAGPWSLASIRVRLVVLTLVLMTPALIVGGVFLYDATQRERQGVETQLSETARALALGVDRQIGQDQALLRGLATSPLLLGGDYTAFDLQARAATPRDVWITVRDDTGRFVVNTSQPRGAPLPVVPDLAPGQWAAVHPDVRISNAFIGALGRPQMIVSRPLTMPDGRIFNIATVRYATALGSILEAQQLPDSWIGTLLDARGAIAARTQDAERYISAEPSPNFEDRIGAQNQGVRQDVMLDGRPNLFGFSRAPHSRWIVAVSAPKSELQAATRDALLMAALAGLGLIALGVVVAARVAEGVVRPIEALATYARDIQGDGATAPKAGRLHEADLVADALTRSAEALNERGEQLRRLNATLEGRIAERTRELAETTETLIQAQKLEAVGRLTGGIAHDFNNLLTAVQGNLELMARRNKDERLSAYIAHARQAAERGAKLTAQLLAFSRRQRLQPEPIDINASVRSASELLKSTLGGTVRVDLDLKPDLAPAMADATQLELIILNLAINARDAMPAGGLITIETAERIVDQGAERPESPSAGEYVTLAVRDTGEGMTPEVLARVFEPFFTTKEVGRGSGLGLPQVLGVTKQLGGGVEIASRPGEGTVVRVFLPRAAADEVRAPETAPGAEPTLRLQGLRVLLVDDDPDVRGVADAMLKDFGCDVRSVASGQAALDVLETGVQVDLVLLDYAMPGLNGAETATRIGARWPALPVIMMSGYADAATLAETWSGPFLHKPFSVAGLSGHLTKLAQGPKVVQLRPTA